MVSGSAFFMPMQKEVKNESIKSHRLMLKSGMIVQIAQGLYFFTPLGLRILRKIEVIVNEWHRHLGFNECLAPNLQPGELWQESGRRGAYEKELMSLNDRHNRELILGPTAEEVFAKVASNYIIGKQSLPLLLYNIQWKYRDEIRPRFGLVRGREFLMSDAYSFHQTEEESMRFYNHVLKAYVKMFEEVGLKTIPIRQNDTGAIGGSLSHEFFVESDEAEDGIEFEQNGETVQSRGIEVGHIYYLGTKYSQPMKLNLEQKLITMGCYGVGVSRLVAALVQTFGIEERHVNKDDFEKDLTKASIFLPAQVAPFKAHVIAQAEFATIAEKIHNLDLENIYYDNTEKNMGEKFAIADLVGAPIRIILGRNFKTSGMPEIKEMSPWNDDCKVLVNLIQKFLDNMGLLTGRAS